MDYKKTKLKNDLRVINTHLADSESATVTIWTKVGSRFEDDKIAGISHFLEHMVFKGTDKRPSSHAIAEAVDSIGAEFNAMTSKEWTCFYIKCRTGVIETAFDVLSDMVKNPLLKQDDIDREKGVIIEEIGMYEDMPMMKVGEYFENLIFEGNDLGRDTIGTRETVKTLSREDFTKYLDKYYSGTNMLLTVAGGVKDSTTHKLAEKYFGDLNKKNKGVDYKKFKEKKGPRFSLHSKKIEQGHIVIGFRGFERGHKDRYTESVLSAILGRGMSSRLFTEVREKRGLAYAVKSDTDNYLDTGYLSAYAGVDPKRAKEALKVILDLHYDLVGNDHDITEEELAKAKEYIKGHLALALEDTRYINQFFGIKELLEGKIRTPEEVYEGINAVTIKDVTKLAKKVFDKDKLYVTIVGPFKNKADFKKVIS